MGMEKSLGEKNKETHMEAMEGRAAEIMIKFGNIVPLWTGVLTKAFTWLIKDIVPQKRKKFIKNYRQILKEFADDTWAIRCEKMYDPALEKERHEKRCMMHRQQREAKNIIKKLKFTGGITTQQIMDMDIKQKGDFVEMNKNNWTQSTLRELNFLSTTTEKQINKRTQSEIQQDSKTTKKRTQLLIQTNGILKKKEEKEKGEVKPNRSKKQKKG